jgi:hypothetical protein
MVRMIAGAMIVTAAAITAPQLPVELQKSRRNFYLCDGINQRP